MKITKDSIVLDNGTVWPNPRQVASGMSDEQALRHYKRVDAAYYHLLMHPVGTEEAIKVLRQLRRAAKVQP